MKDKSDILNVSYVSWYSTTSSVIAAIEGADGGGCVHFQVVQKEKRPAKQQRFTSVSERKIR